MSLTEIVKEIAASYGDIRAQAQAAAVSPQEVAAAFAKAKQDTADHVVLSLLAQFHPLVDAAPVADEE